jgi:hypothetical protein
VWDNHDDYFLIYWIIMDKNKKKDAMNEWFIVENYETNKKKQHFYSIFFSFGSS